MDVSPADAGPSEPKETKKRVRTSTACFACRKKRVKCDGEKPVCSGCKASNSMCEYDLVGDRRKPYGKDVVQAMQLQIESLQAELAAAQAEKETARKSYPPTRSPSPRARDARSRSSSTEPGDHSHLSKRQRSHFHDEDEEDVLKRLREEGRSKGKRRDQLAARKVPMDAFQGGLALNAHGELRLYGPTSAYRAVLAETIKDAPEDLPAATDAARVFSLTRAPLPAAAPAEPEPPRKPPTLSPELETQLLDNAFEFALAVFNLVPKAEFMRDMEAYPQSRTHFYSPFLKYCILGFGARYLEVKEDAPEAELAVIKSLCGASGDLDTKGDVFIEYARNLVDQELYNPKISTIRGFNCLGLYLAGRAMDGPSWMFIGLATRLCEDFGLHLGIHRLSIGTGGISDDLITNRRDAFYSSFATDIILSMYIGRRATFAAASIDTILPPVDHELEFTEPMYRSSAFNWASRLVRIASDIMTEVYALKPGISIKQRHAAVPKLHLALETWNHELPTQLRGARRDARANPAHPHVIALNMLYHMCCIQLHRPFFRRFELPVTRPPSPSAGLAPPVAAPVATMNVSTEKCLTAASAIVKLVRLQKQAHGLVKTAPWFQHCAFVSGTILTLSASEDGISESKPRDEQRRQIAAEDLNFLIESLREIGRTSWTAAQISAEILYNLTLRWSKSHAPPLGVPESLQLSSKAAVAAALQQQQPAPPTVAFPTGDIQLDPLLENWPGGLSLDGPVATSSNAPYDLSAAYGTDGSSGGAYGLGNLLGFDDGGASQQSFDFIFPSWSSMGLDEGGGQHTAEFFESILNGAADPFAGLSA